MGKSVVAIVIVVLVLAAGGYLAFKAYKKNSSQPVNTPPVVTNTTPIPQTKNTGVVSPESSKTAAPAASGMTAENTVHVTVNGFNPSSITIKAGSAVYWINDDKNPHTVNSDPHPTHTNYPPLNLGVMNSGDKKALVFPTAGTYTYHDHLNPNLKGTIVVQ